MIKIPDAIIVDNSQLSMALSTLTPVGFKVYMFIQHRSFYYQEQGAFRDEEAGSLLQSILRLKLDELVNGFVENRKLGYLDGLSIVRYKHEDPRQHRKCGEITFQWYTHMSPTGHILFPEGHPMEIVGRKPDGYAVGLYWVMGAKRVNIEQDGDNSCHWLHIRRLAIARDKHCCIDCGESDDLHVHHLTYKHEGNEQLDELITLCQGCHAKKKSVR